MKLWKNAAAACAFAMAVAASAAVFAQQSWHYTLGEPVSPRQASFCADAEEALRLASVFQRRGPRPGYAALSQSEKCALKVQAFTPQEVVSRVTIEKGKPIEYTVTFFKARTAAGLTEYVMTTRAVHAKR